MIRDMGQRLIQCLFCDWKTPPFVSTKTGRARSGMSRLRNHIEDEHPIEHDRIYLGGINEETELEDDEL